MGGTSGAAGTKSRFKKIGRKGESRIGRKKNPSDPDFSVPEWLEYGRSPFGMKGVEGFRFGPSIRSDGFLDAKIDSQFEDRAMQIVQSWLPEPHKGGGYGTGMYIAAMKEAKRLGVDFVSDVSRSDEAAKVWQGLTDRGLKTGGVRRYGTFIPAESTIFRVTKEELDRWGTKERPWTMLEGQAS